MKYQKKAACWGLLILVFSCLFNVTYSSLGDIDPVYKSCTELCEKSGCIGENCFRGCRFSTENVTGVKHWYMQQEPLYLQWKQWDCRSDCRYHCMMDREKERESLGLGPVKYHGKWPFKRILGLQEPVSVALSALNLAVQFHGWLSFMTLLHYKLPLRPQTNKTYYEFCGLWIVYGVIAMNSWFWSSVFHSRDVDITEKLDYSSAVALLGFGLILSILHAFNVRDEATRVMVAAPLLAFVTTHILYLNFYKLDYGLNMIVCTVMGVVQLLLWGIWGSVTRHPSRVKLLTAVFGTALAMLFEIYDFPPYMGYVDAHAIWHATTIPLTFLWWSFVKDDAEYRTSQLVSKEAEKGDPKKEK